MKRIPKIPQGEISSIKNILYPDLMPKEKKWEIKNMNMNNIKIIEEKNKKAKEEKQKQGPNELYKINKFKNIPSKIKLENNNNNQNKESKKKIPPKTPLTINNKRGGSQNKPSTVNKKKEQIVLPTLNKEEENIYDLLNEKKESMFDQYYAKKARSKTPSKPFNNFEYNNKNPISPFNLNENINNIFNDNNSHNLYENNSAKNNISEISNPISIEEPRINDSSEIERLIKEYKLKYGSDEALENMIKDYSKNKQKLNDLNSIPEVEEKLELSMKKNKNILLPKIEKNYIKENKKLVIENKIPLKHKAIEDNNNLKHKNYGKVPSYIKRYELEREIQKEEIKRQKEAEKIPKGTKLLTEEERINTLNGLIYNKKELINQLEKMPITTRTIAVQNKKEELNQKLDEIEKAIEMFSKKQVFIKI